MRKAAAFVLVLACVVPGSPAAAALPAEEDPVPMPGLKCVERVAMPSLENVIDAKWSPDGATLALVRFVRRPSATNPSGYVEDEILETLDMRSGSLRSFGSIEYGRPAWSASGRYLAYWGPRADFLQVMERGEIVARFTPNMPEFRWSGDALLWLERGTVRVWTGGGPAGTIAKLPDRYIPRYPRDDVNWSGDASRFTLTRYAPDEPEPERFIGWTETADVVPLDVPGALYTEWAPRGATLLIRYPTRLEVRDELHLAWAAIPIARGAVHSWGADGTTLLVRTPRPSAVAGDAFEDVTVVWPASRAATAVLPNVFGTRSFSPNGRYFSGTIRTDRHDSRLDVFRCLEAPRSAPDVPDPEGGVRLAKMDAGSGHLIRPVSGPISQFLHVGHSGVDVAAPFGSPIVAADDGVVTKAEWKDDGGLHVCLRHAAGLETCYFHTSAVLVTVGERVRRGQAIAIVGMSGLTRGPHVHWEAKLDGKVIDPLLR